MGDLDGKLALITGGTSGLGLAMAHAFGREGARVIITGRNPKLGNEAQAELRAAGRDASFLAADAADPEQIRESVAQAVLQLGGLDILVNNAGIGVAASALDTPLEDFDRTMGVNVRGAFVYAQECFPHLAERRGNMIHIASDAGVTAEVEIGIYSVTKAALIMLSNTLAIECGRRGGVRSNTLCPGDTKPGMRHMGPPGDPDRPEDDPSEWPLPPIGRVGEAMDVAEAAVFLASDKASFITGVALLVDGGMRAGARTSTWPDGTVT
ncbi:MAG: meso-butanediol dehydrogenase / (S,S)-butanediol dehydrogenase / diacetyl reductase [Actinomycetota bacterium]|nr:meso-butanediol dehydrogenase / (S,S)-butanediol dehydrogenase / diacetyl reductase [Actinomycetota bacterium]